MSGATTELSLATAVDSDDNADYLTLGLANNLRTVDALFSNTTGHNHGGAHQGGAISTIPISAIPDGSITSAKIADGTIQTVDLADGIVTTAKITSAAVTTPVIDVPLSSSFSTTVTNTWVDTNVKGTGVFSGLGPSLLLYTVNVQHSVANAIFSLGFGLDGVIQQVQGFTTGGATAGFPRIVTIFGWLPALSGSHAISVMVMTPTAGTLSFRGEAMCHIFVLEHKR